jgi:hypothetical protein
MARLNLHGVQVFAQLLALDEGCSPILVVAAGVQADVLSNSNAPAMAAIAR